jgi:predicted secreted protein
MMVRDVVALFSFSLLASSACHGSAPATNAMITPSSNDGEAASPMSAEAGPSETIIHAEDDGKSFDVPRGGAVAFMLPSSAGTGYIWVPTKVDSSILTQQGDRTSDLSSEVPGAAKMDVYHFAATSSGATTVEMSLKRPFGAGAPGRVVHVTLNVR